jgi:hypothetical protein
MVSFPTTSQIAPSYIQKRLMKVGVSHMLKENLLEDRNRILTVGKLLPVEKTLTLSPRMNNAKSTGIAAAILPSMVASIDM